MRPAQVYLVAAGKSPWIPVDYLSIAPSVGLATGISSGGSATWEVDETPDGAETKHPVTVTRATTVITVADFGPDGKSGHLLVVGDDVILQGTGFTGGDGEFTVASVVDANHYTLTSGTSGTATGSPNTYATTFRIFPDATLKALTARTQGSINFPTRAVRLNVGTYGSGTIWLKVLQGLGVAG